jgi:hypothetical protein
LFEAESLLKHERAKEIESNPLHDRHHALTFRSAIVNGVPPLPRRGFPQKYLRTSKSTP